jgi:hypothetical protein
MVCAQDKMSARSLASKSFRWLTCGMLGSRPQYLKEAVFEAMKY